MITRTKDDIKKLHTEIAAELAALPKTNAFGESNDSDREELGDIVKHLEFILNTDSMPWALDENDELFRWLIGKPSLLNIYLEL